jgi:hypothetical protein
MDDQDLGGVGREAKRQALRHTGCDVDLLLRVVGEELAAVDGGGADLGTAVLLRLFGGGRSGGAPP